MLVYMKLHTKKVCVCVSEWSITHVHRKHVKRVVTKKFDHIYNSDALIFFKCRYSIKPCDLIKLFFNVRHAT